VSGSWPAALGTDPQTLEVAAEPTVDTRTVTVTMPNGVPVVGAQVSVESGLATTDNAGGFSFTAPGGGVTDTTTDADGVATLVGYDTSASPSTVKVSFDDGELSQDQTVPLTGADTGVQLEFMPWLTVDDGGGTAQLGDIAPLRFEVDHSAQAAEPSAVQISVAPPGGWSASDCRRSSKLNGITNANGKLKLRVCASASGLYDVTSRGAVPSGQLMLRVKGAPPMPPTSLTARSPQPGQAQLAWDAPAYNGGAHVTEYRAVARHGSTRRVVLLKQEHFTVATRTHTFAHLTRAQAWIFTVKAITKHGVSRPIRCTLRVA
jgi:hypothetical protein